MSIISDIIEDFMAFFMDEFFVVGDYFEGCLENLTQELKDMKKQTCCSMGEVLFHGQRGYYPWAQNF